MKLSYLFLSLVMLSFVSIKAQSQYAIEFNAFSGISTFTSLDAIDKNLNTPLAKDLDFVQSSGGSFTIKKNRWGIIMSSYQSNFTTSPNTEGYYYNGSSYANEIGVSYDLFTAKWFTFSPYITLGGQVANIYLDYQFKEGITPTSLHIEAREPNMTVGGKFYFKVKTWKEDKLQLFFNANVSYRYCLPGVWRVDNMLIDSSDFSLSNMNMQGGLSLRYLL